MARKKLDPRSLALVGLLLAGCASKGTDHHYLHTTEAPPEAAWGYDGAIGPDHWGDLDPAYVLAKTGRKQSPIDIGATEPGPAPALSFDYKSATVDVVYNGHTIEEEGPLASSIQLGDTRYDLKQLHFHSPSEHTVGGEHFPMEMHLVHKSEEGVVAVVSVLLREGEHNAAFQPLWDNLPSAAQKERKSDTTFDIAALLPRDRASYRYEGSFTTPPCTEDVHWIVLRTPVALSAQQIAAFRAVIDGNNRPVQPLNGRRVLMAG